MNLLISLANYHNNMKALLLALTFTIWSDAQYSHFVQLQNGYRLTAYEKQQSDSDRYVVFKAYILAPVDTYWVVVKDTEYIMSGTQQIQYRSSQSKIQFMYEYIAK